MKESTFLRQLVELRHDVDIQKQTLDSFGNGDRGLNCCYSNLQEWADITITLLQARLKASPLSSHSVQKDIIKA